MLHTGIPAYANRNGTLTRLVASFPQLFTTSGDVLFRTYRSSVESERCCEFSKLQDGHTKNACKQTKTLLLAKASELHPLRSEQQIWLSCLPCLGMTVTFFPTCPVGKNCWQAQTDTAVSLWVSQAKYQFHLRSSSCPFCSNSPE